jgi:hypothetical protein
VWEGDTSVTLTADLDYAKTRHDLGVTWTPKAPALDIVRRDPFFSDTVEGIKPQVPDLFADGFNHVWEGN